MKLSTGLGLAGAILLAGCATPKKYTFAPTGDPLADGRTAIAQGPPQDKVLWEYRTAAVCMRRAQFAEAKSLLDDALLTLGGINGKDSGAKKARGYFHEESKKTFIGEPYERVMAYYYRGILYWMDGEPDNARACFRSGQLIDSDTENKQYAADYVLLDYLDGFATVKLAGDGSDALKRAQTEARLGPPPAYNPKANTLVFLEFGRGPGKYAAGEYGEQLRFREGSAATRGAVVQAGSQNVRVGPYDDVSFQATTRGGRVMDHILGNKAVFKSSTDIAGNAALLGGVVAASNRRTQEIGLGLVAAGVLTKIISSATTPAADVRAWDNLPQYLSFAALELPPGEQTVTVQFVDASGRPLPNGVRQAKIQVVPGHDTVLFFSDQAS